MTVAGVLTTGTSLLDASGRRTIVEDGSGAIEVYLASPDASLRAGTRVRVTGTVGQAWGAPRLRAESVERLGTRDPAVHDLRSAPTAAMEWRLVRMHGTIEDVHRSGDRWTAELVAGGARVPISGLAGSGIPSTAVVEGRQASIIGIVKRPYPTATDRRFALVPRRSADIALGAAPAATASAAATASGGASPATPAGGTPVDASGPAAAPASRPASSTSTCETCPTTSASGCGSAGSSWAWPARRSRSTTAPPPAASSSRATRRGSRSPSRRATPSTRPACPTIGTGPSLVVDDPSGIELVGDLGGVASPAAVARGDRRRAVGCPPRSHPPVPPRPVRSGAPGAWPMAAGILALTLIGVATAALSVGRRRRDRRRFRARIAARLDALAGRSGGRHRRVRSRRSGPRATRIRPPRQGETVRGSA